MALEIGGGVPFREPEGHDSFFDQKLKDIDGNDMLINPSDKSKGYVTLAYVLKQVLLGEYPNEKIEAEEKLKRYKLAMGISDYVKDKFPVTMEEIVFLRKLSGTACNTFIFGQVDSILPK